MKIHFENMGQGGVDKNEQKEEKRINQLYNKVKPIIMKSSKGDLNEKVMSKISQFAIDNGQNEDEVVLSVLECYYNEQGALPDKLGEQYIDLVFSPEAIQSKMLSDNLGFYEVAAVLGKMAKSKNLDEALVNEAIKIAEKELIK